MTPPFMPDAAQGPALPCKIRRPPANKRPAWVPTSPSTRTSPPVIRLADAIKPIAGAFDANALRVAHAQAKNLSDIDARPGRLQFDALDLRRRFAGKEVRDQRR